MVNQQRALFGTLVSGICLGTELLVAHVALELELQEHNHVYTASRLFRLPPSYYRPSALYLAFAPNSRHVAPLTYTVTMVCDHRSPAGALLLTFAVHSTKRIW